MQTQRKHKGYKMKVQFKKDNNILTIEIVVHRVIVRTYHIMCNSEASEIRQVLRFIREESELGRLYFKGKHKELLKACAEADKRYEPYYKDLYSRGGYRKNAGRKIGSLQSGAKSERTARFTMAITEEEKEYLTKTLMEYRAKKQDTKKGA